MKWSELAYWRSGEWQVVMERLKDEKARKTGYVPARRVLFRSLDLVPFGEVRCVVVGQDPYPNPDHATGVAFSVPPDITRYPPTLVNIFQEYQDDLKYPAPKNGDLTPWCEQGVLLWNAYPTTMTGFPAKHHWCEWELLTNEILHTLSTLRPGLAYVFLGRVAGKFRDAITRGGTSSGDHSDHDPAHSNFILETSHPSPLGAKHGFLGSRLFSKVNSGLVQLGQSEINWRLPDADETPSSAHESDAQADQQCHQLPASC